MINWTGRSNRPLEGRTEEGRREGGREGERERDTDREDWNVRGGITCTRSSKHI